MKNKKLYVFGNEYLENDSFALKVAQHLEMQVIHCKSPEDLLDVFDEEILILDVVKNITKPIIITDVDKLKSKNIVSLHDFDLGFFLKLLKELDMEKNIKIIGIPMSGDEQIISEQVKSMLENNDTGLDLIVRFAYSPTAQELCASPDNLPQFLEYLKANQEKILTNETLEKTRGLVLKYPNMMAYLNFIAQKSSSPVFSYGVAEAYVFGNSLLDNFTNNDVKELITGLVSKGLLLRSNSEKILSIPPKNMLPHHNFYVFHVSHLKQMGMNALTLQRLDNCRVSYGKIIEVVDSMHMIVETDTLEEKDKKLNLIPDVKTVKYDSGILSPKLDEYVALHWGFAFSKISNEQRNNLEKYTKLLLE